MRLLILFFVLMQLLWADKPEVCYSVSLLSAVNTTQNRLKLLKRYNASKECKILTIGSMLSVRCGCYRHLKKARQKLELLKKQGDYKNIIVAPTYRYRFEGVKKPKKVQMRATPTLAVTDSNVSDTMMKKKPQTAPVFKEDESSKQQPSNYEMIKLNDEPVDASQNTQTIDLTLLGRYLSNKNIYKHSPYFFALFESAYEGDNYTLSGGLGFQSINKNEELLINNLELKYFADEYTFRIGKMVRKVGVLDYFSLLDTLNPSRGEFFYDTQLNIKKVPLWMSSVDYFVNDEIKLSAFVQPLDTKHNSYRSVYVDYLLNQFVPEYFDNIFSGTTLGQEVYYPVYRDSLVPYLQDDIDAKAEGSKIYLNKLSFGFLTEYSDDIKRVGILYGNRYSEIPMIKIDQNLLDAAIAYKEGNSPGGALINYIASGDYDLIKSVKDFRYQEGGIYAESTVGSYGVRAELMYRDKVPLLNKYSGLASVGFAVDKLFHSVYNVLETQYLYLERYHKSAYISMLRTRFERDSFWIFSGYFENSLIASRVDTKEEYAIVPNYTISYKQIDLSIGALFSKNNPKTNTLNLLLRGKF